jgi:ArsR family transcriptional regulator
MVDVRLGGKMKEKETLKVLKAMSDETRLKILKFLLDGEKCVCEIFPYVKRTQSTVSIQLGKLENLGVLESRRMGKKVFYRIKDYRVCDVFKALGYTKGKILKKRCCMGDGK